MLENILKGIEVGAIVVIYPKGAVPADVVVQDAPTGENVVKRTVEPTSQAEPGAGVPSAEATAGAPLPEDTTTRVALINAIYNSFGEYRRRSLNALCRATGLSGDAILELLADNTDFNVSVGRESGDTYVSVRGLR